MEFVVVPETTIVHSHLAQISITPNQQGKFEMKDGVLDSAGAQDMVTGSYGLSELEDIEFFWDTSQVELDAAFKPVMGTPFSTTALNNL